MRKSFKYLNKLRSVFYTLHFTLYTSFFKLLAFRFRVLAFSFLLLAFGPFETFAQGTAPFIKTFGLNGYYYGKDIIRCKDSTFIFVGSSDIDNWHNSDALIVRLDSNLNQMIWNKNIGGINVDWATGIAEDSDTTFIVCGYSNSYSANSDYDIRCLKISITGNIIWQKSYGGNDWDFAYAIKKLSDNNFLISGKSASNTFGKDNGYALKINSDGDTLWQKYYAVNFNSGFNKATELKDSSLVFAGFIENELPHINKNGLIVATDANGNFKWQQQYGDTLEDELKSVETSKLSNVFWACGYTEGKSGWKGKQKYVLKLDYSGSIYVQDSTSGVGGETYYDINETLDTNIVLINHTTYGGYGKDVQSFKFDRDINFNAASSFGYTKEDICYSLKILDIQRYVAIGYTNSFNNSLASILIIYGFINQIGVSVSSEINSIKSVSEEISSGSIIYPNPFSGMSYIRTNILHPSFSLFNGLGQLISNNVYSVKKTGPEFIFKNENLTTGMYFLKIHNERSQQILKLNIY